ncbi:MAG: hypothetical protein JWL77_6801, partial [Chthonomonadaceae bacterium]|nr:hypothetical protein [Chthonomonadaceae bacterium]
LPGQIRWPAAFPCYQSVPFQLPFEVIIPTPVCSRHQTCSVTWSLTPILKSCHRSQRWLPRTSKSRGSMARGGGPLTRAPCHMPLPIETIGHGSTPAWPVLPQPPTIHWARPAVRHECRTRSTSTACGLPTARVPSRQLPVSFRLLRPVRPSPP